MIMKAERRKGVEVFIGVGSDIAPEENVPAALVRLKRFVKIKAVSTFYRTPPLGRPQDPPFYNGVVLGETGLSPRELKYSVLRPIEEALGRVRTHDRYGARPVDLDILLYGREVVREPDLCIPDPDLKARAFLARAVLELAPDLILPDTGELLAEVAPQSEPEPLEEFTERLKRTLLGLA